MLGVGVLVGAIWLISQRDGTKTTVKNNDGDTIAITVDGNVIDSAITATQPKDLSSEEILAKLEKEKSR